MENIELNENLETLKIENEKAFIDELNALKEKYNVTIHGMVSIDDYFQIQKAFLEGTQIFLTNRTYVKSNI